MYEFDLKMVLKVISEKFLLYLTSTSISGKADKTYYTEKVYPLSLYEEDIWLYQFRSDYGVSLTLEKELISISYGKTYHIANNNYTEEELFAKLAEIFPQKMWLHVHREDIIKKILED